MVHRHDGPFFTGSVLRIAVERKVAFIVLLLAEAVLMCRSLSQESSEFNIFHSSLNRKNITTINGEGLLTHRGDVEVHDGTLTLKQSQEVRNAVFTLNKN